MISDLERPFIWLARACVAGLCVMAGVFHG